VHEHDGATDGNLLDLYIRHKDEAAFESLVRRHGPMVLGVCRRILSKSHDAEDAFQATFLVLVRKAAGIRPAGMVGNWLYGVAHRTALEARRSAAQRRAKEAHVAPRTETPEDPLAHLRPLLDQELTRLGDKYRAVLVLCDLEGRTRKEAAQQLGLPEGTIASRQARARNLLAKRLTRHGVTISGGALAAALAQEAVSASAPLSLVLDTVRAATAYAAGAATAAAAVSAPVAALTEGVLRAMLLSKLTMGAAVLVVVGFLGAGLAVSPAFRTEASGSATATRPAAPNNDKERLQGTWQQVSCQGKDEVPEDLVKDTTLVIEGDTITVQTSGRASYELAFTLDESQEPKAVDELLVKPEKGNKPYLGIYALEGDNLKFCFSDPGKARPTAFRGEADSGWTLTVFKKKQPSPAQPGQTKAEPPAKDNTNRNKAPDQDQAGQVLDMILKGFQAQRDKKLADQDLAKLLWELVEKSYRPPDGKQPGPEDRKALDLYKQAFLMAFQTASAITKATIRGWGKIRPEDGAFFDAYGPAFVQACERARALKKTLEGRKAAGGKENNKTIEALDVFLKAGREFEQAVKLRAKTQAVEHARKEIESAFSTVEKTAHDRRTTLEALDEIERLIKGLKKQLRDRKD
jgi:RNA polymerase sigma factor (sigma-70 family)